MISVIKVLNTIFRLLFVSMLLLIYAYFPDTVSLRSTYFNISLNKEVLFYVFLIGEIILYSIIRYCIYVLNGKKMDFLLEPEKEFFCIWLYVFSVIMHICFITTFVFLNILNNAEHIDISNYGYIPIVSVALVGMCFLFLFYKIIRFVIFRISSSPA